MVDRDADEHAADDGSAMAMVTDDGGGDDDSHVQRHDHRGPRAHHCRHRYHPRRGGGLV